MLLNVHLRILVFLGCGLWGHSALAQQVMPRLVRSITPPSAINFNTVGATEDARGNLWFATNEGVVRFDGQQFKAYHDPVLRQGDDYFHVIPSPDGRIWCKLGRGSALSYIDYRLDKIVRVPDSTRLVREYLSQWRSNYLFADADANLWIGLRRRGLIRFNPRTYAVEKVFDREGEAVRWITQDRQGTIWFTTGAGVYAYNPVSRRLKQYRDELGSPNRRSADLANRVFALGIHARRDGTILVGMFNEVDVIHPTTGRVTRLELIPPRATVDRSVFDFHDDPQGNTYFFGSTASYRYTARGELQQLEFGGLPHPVQYLFPSRNNRLWVMAGRKLYEYDLTQVRPIPALNLLDVMVNGNRLTEPTAQQQLVRDSLGHPTLTVQEGDLINLRVSPYIENLTRAFRLRLAGYDRQWNVIEDAANTVSYQLPAGTYTLQANRFINSSDWEKDVASLTIIVQPPFWKTGWFWAFALIVTVAIGTGLLQSWSRRRTLRQELAQRAFEAATLRQVDTVKSQFFANVTHEFRTPLTIILNDTEQLVSTSLTLSQQNRVDSIQRHAHQLLRLITETLDMARLDAGKLDHYAYLGNPIAFIRQVVDQFRGLASQRTIALSWNADTSPAANQTADAELDHLYVFDSEKWEKITYNLLANALKFTPIGGQVVVTGRITDDRSFVLQVGDTGIGIPPDQLSRIFERFHQVDASTTRAYSGTGIGLALVKELTDWLGGHIAVTSEPGRGSVFTVELPVQPQSVGIGLPSLAQTATEVSVRFQSMPADADPRKPAGPASDKPLVLVVEDNADLRSQIADYLADQYQILTAATGRWGWEQALAEVPDLIVSDVMMPEMDGYELTRRLKDDERTSHIPVILLTARSSPDSRLKGLQVGADDYLGKPFSLAELTLRIGNGLRTRQNWKRRFTSLGATAAPVPVTTPEPELDREEQFVNRLRQAILAHIDMETLDVDWLAAQAGMGRTQLHRKLTALTSLSPNRFIHRVRLERAVELLQTGELNVAQVAYQVGYSSQSYFAKVFQEHFGYTPTKLKGLS